MAKKKKVSPRKLSAIDRKLKTVNNKIAALKKNKALKDRLQQKINALKKATAQLAGLKRKR